MKRRNFIKSSFAAPAVLSTAPALRAQSGNSLEKLNVAVLGSGLRGQSHIDLLLRRDDCTVTAVADIDQEMIRRTKALFDKAGKSQPTYYDQGPEDFRRLLEKEDLDAVMVASPWRWHTPMAVAAMQAGCYTGTEVCGAFP